MNSIIIFVVACMTVTVALVINGMKKSFNEKVDILEHEIESQKETSRYLANVLANVDDRVNNLNDETVEKMNELINTSNAHHYSYEDLSENFVNLHNTIAYDLEKRVLYLENKVNGGANAKVTSTPCN